MLKSHVVRSASQFKGIRTFARLAVRCSRARRAVEDPSPVGTLRAAGPVRPVASNSGGDVARGERGGGEGPGGGARKVSGNTFQVVRRAA